MAHLAVQERLDGRTVDRMEQISTNSHGNGTLSILKILTFFQYCDNLFPVVKRSTRGGAAISQADQIAVLASPLRQEILDVLARTPDASVAAIAAALGRPADALYYHLRALMRVGLIVLSGRARGQRRLEALYRTANPDLKLAHTPESPVNLAVVSRAITSMLRLGTRDFRRALSSREASAPGLRRELTAARVTGWLAAADVAEVHRLFKRIVRILDRSQAGRGTRLFAVTYLLVPLDRRPRRQKERRPAKRR